MTLAHSAHYYSLLAVYFGLGFMFSFLLWPISHLRKIRSNMDKKNIVMFFFIIIPLFILISFWAMIFSDEHSTFINQFEVFIPFCFIASDLIWLRFFSRDKKYFKYILFNLALAIIIYIIAIPVSSVFSFNGLEYVQNHGLVSAVIFLTVNVLFADILELSDNETKS